MNEQANQNSNVLVLRAGEGATDQVPGIIIDEFDQWNSRDNVTAVRFCGYCLREDVEMAA